jgi:hypothetical protein
LAPDLAILIGASKRQQAAEKLTSIGKDQNDPRNHTK